LLLITFFTSIASYFHRGLLGHYCLVVILVAIFGHSSSYKQVSFVISLSVIVWALLAKCVWLLSLHVIGIRC